MDKAYCKHCGKEQPAKIHQPNSVHTHGGFTCNVCGRMYWHPKPQDDPTKYRREKKHTDLVQSYSSGYCQMCMRDENLIRSINGQTLHAHHVVPYQFGGSSDRENIWILCTPCHAYVEHARRYTGDLVKIKILCDAIIQKSKPYETE